MNPISAPLDRTEDGLEGAVTEDEVTVEESSKVCSPVLTDVHASDEVSLVVVVGVGDEEEADVSPDLGERESFLHRFACLLVLCWLVMVCGCC